VPPIAKVRYFSLFNKIDGNITQERSKHIALGFKKSHNILTYSKVGDLYSSVHVWSLQLCL